MKKKQLIQTAIILTLILSFPQGLFAVPTVPGAPTSVTAEHGNQQVTVSFTAPEDSGGAEITSYTVTSNPGEITASGAASPITVTGLTNGTEYTFTVVATNSAGDGPASEPSNAVTPMTVPDAPTDLSATTTTTSRNQINLSWTAPGDNGGSAITGYKIERESPTAGGFAPLVADTGSTDITYQDTGLDYDTEYNYKVSAINAEGTGDPSNADSATTSKRPPKSPSYSISIGTDSNPLITGDYTEGASITVNVPLKEGYTFLHWEDEEGNVLGTDKIYSFTVSRETEVIPIYEKIEEAEDIIEEKLTTTIEEKQRKQIRSLLTQLISLLEQRVQQLMSQITSLQ